MVRFSSVLLVAGLALFAAGLALWQAHMFDLALHRALLLDRGGLWVSWTLGLSVLGGFLVMGPVALAVVAWLAWRGQRARALWLFATITSGRLLVEGIKLLVQRPRPPVADRLEDINSWSFPSSHSAGTMMTAAALALLAGGRTPAWLAALAAAGAVGWSRIALGVHWPSDVLAGWGFGLVWVGAAWRYGGPMRSG